MRGVFQSYLSNSFRSLNTILLMVLCCIVFQSCHKKVFKTKQDLLAYVVEEKHELTKHKQINGVDFVLTYRPTDLLVAQEIQIGQEQNQIEKLRDKYSGYMYFNLSMSYKNREVLTAALRDRSKYQHVLKNLAFNMRNKIKIYNKEGETFPLADCIFPRMYDLDGKNTLLLVVKRDEQLLKTDSFKITLKDIGLYTGEVTFKVPSRAILQQPSISFDL